MKEASISTPSLAKLHVLITNLHVLTAFSGEKKHHSLFIMSQLSELGKNDNDT